MISKELLNEVLNKNVTEFETSLNLVGYTYIDEVQEDDELKHIDVFTSINIYELAHKCKEWALCSEVFDKEYHKGETNSDGLCTTRITSIKVNIKDLELDYLHCNFDSKKYEAIIICTTLGGRYDNSVSFKADTEHEAVFKACQWILDNKDK